MAKSKSETPLMKQYYGIKAKYPGAVVLFRVGDFYETFDEDAKIASKVLGIVLTKRANGSASEIHLAGFPHHSVDTYLPKLVRAGYRVAICDQLEDPKKAKTIVKRGVTELVTPGVNYNENILESKSSNFLCAIWPDDTEIGISFLDISTGDFFATQCELVYAKKLLTGMKPAEILSCRQVKEKVETICTGIEAAIQYLDDWVFTQEYAEEKLLKQFKASTLKGFGIGEMPMAIISAGACLNYLEQTHHNHIEHINTISRIDQSEYMWLDQFTIKNLELLQPIFREGKCLVDVLDKTKTPMGSRLLKQWMILPLKNSAAIQKRHKGVAYFTENKDDLTSANAIMAEMGDLQRLISKVALGRIGPRECLHLHNTLVKTVELKELLKQAKPLASLVDAIHPCNDLIALIFNQIQENAPLQANKGDIFKKGINEELDYLRDLKQNGKNKLLEIQALEQNKTGIASLKIGFNNVFGYFLEVTHAHKDKVPAEWVRKQTLTTAERYITAELKEYEEKILNAEDRIFALETELWMQFLTEIQDFVNPVQSNAKIIAQLDCLMGFAVAAIENKYVKPEIVGGRDLELVDSRHPVIESILPPDETYVSNSITLKEGEDRILIITGPNMSGKSALLRQTALCILMAQMGSFVPCSAAKMGVFDKVYSRVGASDNISQGESTFMVEMLETASILNNIGDNSLIILDEIGRGTSTYDGVSLAWSIVEYLQSHVKMPKTLFATHYHELNELEHKLDGVTNFHLEVKETPSKILFLRKLIRGGSESSFGIHVAQMAGIPNKVLLRANELLHMLESDRAQLSGKETLRNASAVPVYQLSMFQTEDPSNKRLKEALQKLDINLLSPLDALLKIQELKSLVVNEKFTAQ